MKIKAFQFSIILLILGVISIFVPSAVFADGHETEGEISQELEAVTEELEVAEEEVEQVTATIKNLEEKELQVAEEEVIQLTAELKAKVEEAKSEKEILELKVEEEKPGVSGWFQIDIDSLGSYFLIGASHPVGGISIASNIYVNEKHDYNHEDGSHSHRYLGEFDLGVTVPVVSSDSLSLALQPMVGIGFDYTGADGPHALYPQVFAFLNAPNLFFFHWSIGTIYTIFDDMRSNELYNRTYLTYSLNETIAIGPQVESVFVFADELDKPLKLNFGARLNINYGTANTLGLYFGYETKKGDDETGLTGRMNFTRFW